MALWSELDTMQIQINKGSYECDICDTECTSPIQLTIHCIVEHRIMPCTKCLKLYENEASLLNHTCVHRPGLLSSASESSASYSSEIGSSSTENRSMDAKMCELCELWILPEELLQHNQDVHKITTKSTMTLNITADSQNQFQCHLCGDCRPLNRMDKLFSHFVFFHKYSLQSLLRCILSNNGINPIQSISSGNESTTNSKCKYCGLAYEWSVPKIYHRIYCQGHVYCSICQICFDDQQNFDEHSEHCKEQPMKTTFCDDCNNKNSPIDELHLQNVHNYSKMIPLTDISSLWDSENRCILCDMDFNIEATNLNVIIKHFSRYHHLNAAKILKLLKKRQAVIQPTTNNEIRSQNSVVSLRGNDFNVKQEDDAENNEIMEENEATVENAPYIMDFDSKIVKYVYSSESDYDSADSADELTQPIKSYQCEMCMTRSKSKFTHAIHMHKKHGFTLKPIRFRCSVCKKNFASSRSLKTHFQRVHHKEGIGKRYSCPFCAFSSNKKQLMRRHLSEHVEISYHPCHLKSIGFNCNYCHFILWTKEKLSEHELCRHSEHASETYLLCQYCFFSCNNLSTLRSHNFLRHIEQQQPDGDTFQCIICRIVFYSIAATRIHMQEMHPQLQAIYCAEEKCLQMMTNGEELNMHWIDKHLSKSD